MPKKISRVSFGEKKHGWMFPKIGVPQNGWFIMENPIRMDDLGVPFFLETPTCLLVNDVYVFCFPK